MPIKQNSFKTIAAAATRDITALSIKQLRGVVALLFPMSTACPTGGHGAVFLSVTYEERKISRRDDNMLM